MNEPNLRFPGFTGPWEQRELGEETTEMVAGGDIDKNLIQSEGKYPVIANALTNDGIVGYYKNEYRIKAPAVTVTGRGDVGHAQARNVDFTPVVRLLSVKSKHDIYFLENAINTLRIVIESTGVPQLTVPQLAKYQIAFPESLDEERKIGEYFRNLDRLITLHQRKCERLENLKKGMMQKLFSQEVRFKDDNGHEFPEWEEEKLGAKCSITTGKKDANAMNKIGQYKFFTCSHDDFMIDTYSFDGDAILIAGNGDIGYTKFYSGKFDAYQRTYVLMNFINNVNFVKSSIDYYLPRKINSDALGGAMPYIKLKTLTELKIQIPCLEEQKKIADCLSKYDDAIEIYKRQIAAWKELKRGLLHEMFV